MKEFFLPEASDATITAQIIIMALLIGIYSIQIVCVWIQIILGDIDSKSKALWFHVPFLPIICMAYKKFMSMGD